VSGAGDDRADLLALLERYRGSSRAVRRTETWRRRGWPARRIASEADRVAGALAAAGLDPGDRVALFVGDGPLWHAGFFGALRAGAVVVPLDEAMGPEILRERAAELELRGICRGPEVPRIGLDLATVEIDWRGEIQGTTPPPLPEDDPDRIAEVVLTSGTTGVPSAVPVSHVNVRAVLDALEQGVAPYRTALRVLPRLRLAVALPLSHLYGQVMGAFVPALLDAHVSMLSTMPAPELARRLREERATVLATVPRTLALLESWLRSEGEVLWGAEGLERRLQRAPDLPWWYRPLAFFRLRRRLGTSLVAVVSGGAALDPEVETFWRALGYVVVQGYGLTETAPLVTLDHPFDTAPGSLGRPLPGVEVRIARDGEILVRGPNVAAGGSGVDEEGWLHTGDLGRFDAEGRLRFRGRRGERIVTPAGENIDLEPIAARLRGRNGVRDAIVLERPWGEPGAVAAILLLSGDADPGTIVSETNEALPDAARIRAWRVWPEHDFPRTRTGKPRRAEIEAWLADHAPAGPSAEGEPPRSITGVEGITRLVAEIAGVPPGEIDDGVRLADVLGSLDRVDLATRLETTTGVALDPASIAGERTIGEVARIVGEAGPPDTSASPPERREPAPADATPRQAEAAPSPGPEQRSGPARPPEARWRARWPVRIGRHVLREAILRSAWRSLFDHRVGGLENLRGVEPPFLLAANHLSILDAGIVLFGLPARLRGRFAVAAMWEHFPGRPTGGFQYSVGVFGLDLVPLVTSGDWRPTLRIAGRVADRGGCLLIFPEGERSTSDELLPFRRGAGVMARELHLPVVPCGIAGTRAVLPAGARWARECWWGRAPVSVRFGAPLEVPGPEDDPAAVVDGIRREIEGLAASAREEAGRW